MISDINQEVQMKENTENLQVAFRVLNDFLRTKNFEWVELRNNNEDRCYFSNLIVIKLAERIFKDYPYTDLKEEQLIEWFMNNTTCIHKEIENKIRKSNYELKEFYRIEYVRAIEKEMVNKLRAAINRQSRNQTRQIRGRQRRPATLTDIQEWSLTLIYVLFKDLGYRPGFTQYYCMKILSEIDGANIRYSSGREKTAFNILRDKVYQSACNNTPIETPPTDALAIGFDHSHHTNVTTNTDHLELFLPNNYNTNYDNQPATAGRLDQISSATAIQSSANQEIDMSFLHDGTFLDEYDQPDANDFSVIDVDESSLTAFVDKLIQKSFISSFIQVQVESGVISTEELRDVFPTRAQVHQEEQDRGTNSSDANQMLKLVSYGGCLAFFGVVSILALRSILSTTK